MVVWTEKLWGNLLLKTISRHPLHSRCIRKVRAQNALLLRPLLPEVLQRHPQLCLPLPKQRLQMLFQEL